MVVTVEEEFESVLLKNYWHGVNVPMINWIFNLFWGSSARDKGGSLPVADEKGDHAPSARCLDKLDMTSP